jgi:dienelactone hydrolase
MSVTIHKNIELEGACGQAVLLDLYHPAHQSGLPTVIFAHGFKGFKDWGGWDLIARHFANAGFAFIKFNFSHNGLSCENLSYHTAIEAFGHNNYTKELADLDSVINWVSHGIENLPAEVCDPDRICLIGHSRGGGISLIKAAQDSRIKALITWAAVSTLDYAWQEPGFIDRWRAAGLYEVLNHRTKQRFPVYFQMYQDFIAHEQAYDTQAAISSLRIPVLLLHGTADASIHHEAALQLAAWQPAAELRLLAGADHSFGMTHPLSSPQLPSDTEKIVDYSIDFLRRQFEKRD